MRPVSASPELRNLFGQGPALKNIPGPAPRDLRPTFSVHDNASSDGFRSGVPQLSPGRVEWNTGSDLSARAPRGNIPDFPMRESFASPSIPRISDVGAQPED